MKKYVVFGNPISHSLSPQLQCLFAKQFSMAIDYQKCFVPLDQFKSTVDAFREQGGNGANITIPFKTNALDYADTLTDRAKEAGAVNTFIFKNTTCLGDNTDGIGFIRDLYNKQITIHNKKIMIIGAGGATRGILGGIIREKPHKIVIVNRTVEKTQALINFFQSHLLSANDNEDTYDLIVNATNIHFQKDFFREKKLTSSVCYDLNYGERHRTFYDYAKSHGAEKIENGLGMLIEQGAESFFHWTGKMPDTRNIQSLL